MNRSEIIRKYEKKILKLPMSIVIEGSTFDLCGGSLNSFEDFVRNKKWTVYVGYQCYDEKGLDFYFVYVIFKWRNNALTPVRMSFTM